MSLLRAASVVSVLTLASRVTGLVREQLLGASFGAGLVADAYQVAFRIPNLLRRLFAEGAFSQAFVPILAASRTQEGDEATHRLMDAAATVLFWVLMLTATVGVVGAPVLVWVMASGLPAEGFDHAVIMTRIMFPYILCMSLVALSAGILNTWKHFVVPAVTPVLLNLSVIGAGWWLSPVLEQRGIPAIYGWAIGVMVGGVLQLGIQIPALLRLGLMPKVGLGPAALKAAWGHEGVHRILRRMGPALLGVSVAQLSLMINTQIASRLAVGSVSSLTYADRLMEFPTALLGVALGVVLLPQLSSARAAGQDERYSSLLDWGLRLVVLLSLPCAVALVVFPEPLIAVVYHYRHFTAEHVANTTRALIGWGVGLVGIIGVKVLAPGFYAQQDTRTPVKIAVVVLVLTQVFNAVLVPHLGVAGLSLSIGLASSLNALFLLTGLRRRGSYQPAEGWWGFLFKVAIGSAVMGVGMFWAAQHFDWIGLGVQPLLRVAIMAGCLTASAVLYFLTLALLGVPLRQFARKA